jgi:hypothetical protein
MIISILQLAQKMQIKNAVVEIIIMVTIYLTVTALKL